MALYFRAEKLNNKSIYVKYLLFAFRFISVTLISFLLLTPLIKKISEQKVKPVVLIAQDYSMSLKNVYSSEKLSEINNSIHLLSKELSDKYNVQEFSLGGELKSGFIDSFHLKSTNISALENYANEVFDNKELAAVIFSSDGIYNQGSNPDYVRINNTAPIYTIALGDTTIKKDASIQSIYHNNISYLGDKSAIKADLRVQNAKGQNITATLSKIPNPNQKIIIDKKLISVNSNDYITSLEFIIDNNEAGVNKYNLSISNLDSEVSYKNNSRDFFIEVIDSKLSVLIYANAPHPDLSAVRDILLNLSNYKIDIKYAGDKVDISSYDIVIYHNLPSQKNDISNLHNDALKKNIPEFFIAGTQTDIRKFNTIQNLISISNFNNSTNDVQAIKNEDFSLFKLENEHSEDIKYFPPLISPFGDYKASPDGEVMYWQKIKNIETKYPLLSFSSENQHRTGVFNATNFYKWKFYEFQQYKEVNLVTSILNQSIQYLTVKKDKSKWQVSINKHVYDESDNLIFYGELYNDNYQRINEPEASLKIFDSSDRSYDFTFTRVDDHYEITTGSLFPGEYNYTATTKYNGETLTKKGKFTVKSTDLELYDIVADHNLMNKLSARTGGKMYYPSGIKNLKDELLKSDAKPVLYFSELTSLLLDNKLFFWLIMLLLAVEWFIRKLNGTV